jgi:hypothetical protein
MPEKIMLTQQEWVEGCYAYYAENGYEPGNPEDGIWEDAHYPVPRCEGGSETIKLLKQHHAVQGVLQSEEYQRPCIWGWEADYLEGEMLALCKKWHTQKSYAGAAAVCPMKRSEAARKGNASLTPEQRRERARRANATMTPEQRSERSRRSQASRSAEAIREQCRRAGAATTTEVRSEAARRGWANLTPEQRSERARRAAETYRRRKADEAATLRDVSSP